MPKSEKLIIGQKVKQKLNKSQQTFNRLVKKLEKLRRDKEKSEKRLSADLEYYGKHIHPLEEKMADLHARSAKLFYKFYREQTKLTKGEKETLIGIIATQMDGFLEYNRQKLDDELKEIFEFVEEESYDEALKSDFEAMKEDMTDTFKEMGLEVDLDDFNSDLSEEEMMRKMAEILGRVKEQAEVKAAAEPERKKTKKQLEKEAREKEVEEAKNKSISSIYKQLARVFHPDLEQDADRKLEKEDLMKKLTNAYEKGDLHALLSLELEWISKEENDLDKLSDEKLNIYNQALKEQIEDLETEIYIFKQHPRYAPLQKYVRFFSVDSINLPYEEKQLKDKVRWLEKNLAQMSGDVSLKQIKETIRAAKRELKESQMFDLSLDDLFG